MVRCLSLIIERRPEFQHTAAAVYKRVKNSKVVFDPVLVSGREHEVVHLYCQNETVPHVLHDVALHHGIGTLEGTRVAIAEVLALEPVEEDPEEQARNISSKTWSEQIVNTRYDRLAIQEMYANIDATSGLSFDFMCLLACAGILAALGLLSDDLVTLISAMLLSPLASPINCISFGIAAGRKDLMWRGLRNELIGAVMTFFFGLLVGGIFGSVYGPNNGDQAPGPERGVPGNYEWPFVLEEQALVSRGTSAAVIVGIGVAMASGVAMVLAVTGKARCAHTRPPVSSACPSHPPARRRRAGRQRADRRAHRRRAAPADCQLWRLHGRRGRVARPRGRRLRRPRRRRPRTPAQVRGLLGRHLPLKLPHHGAPATAAPRHPSCSICCRPSPSAPPPQVATGIVWFRIKGVVPTASDWAISHVRCRTLSGFPNELLLSGKKEAKAGLTLGAGSEVVDAVVGTELVTADGVVTEPGRPPNIRLRPEMSVTS